MAGNISLYHGTDIYVNGLPCLFGTFLRRSFCRFVLLLSDAHKSSFCLCVNEISEQLTTSILLLPVTVRYFFEVILVLSGKTQCMNLMYLELVMFFFPIFYICYTSIHRILFGSIFLALSTPLLCLIRLYKMYKLI